MSGDSQKTQGNREQAARLHRTSYSKRTAKAAQVRKGAKAENARRLAVISEKGLKPGDQVTNGKNYAIIDRIDPVTGVIVVTMMVTKREERWGVDFISKVSR